MLKKPNLCRRKIEKLKKESKPKEEEKPKFLCFNCNKPWICNGGDVFFCSKCADKLNSTTELCYFCNEKYHCHYTLSNNTRCNQHLCVLHSVKCPDCEKIFCEKHFQKHIDNGQCINDEEEEEEN